MLIYCPKCGGKLIYVGKGGGDFIQKCEKCGLIIRGPWRKRRWLILGSLGLGLFGYFDQEIRCKAHWDWGTLWHHEPLVAMAVCVGIALLVVHLINKER